MHSLLQDLRYGFRVLRLNPTFTTAAVLILVAVALAAGFVPAHRATRVDPMVALRSK